MSSLKLHIAPPKVIKRVFLEVGFYCSNDSNIQSLHPPSD